MPNQPHLQAAIASILRRVKELRTAGGGSDEVVHAELLARLVDKTATLDELPDDSLEACRTAFGTCGMVDALLHGSAETTKQAANDDTPVTLGRITPDGKHATTRWWQRTPGWIALAAVVALVVGLSVHWLSQPAPTAGPSQVAVDLQWPGSHAFDPAGAQRWTSLHNQLAPGLPDFNIATATLGPDRSDAREAWRLATVIVRSEHGFGSGAFISPSGWVLTNYHVVADPAQQAALTGTPAKLQIITAHVIDGHIKPAAAVPATLYRADPEHDLALLKLDSMPAGLTEVPYFKLASKIDDNADCYVVGSQYNGPAWWVRGTNISQRFDFPDDLSQVAAGVDTQNAAIDRSHMTVLVSDARVSPGDSGGPLLNAKGELIGLTFATSANSSAGSVGWHIALQHLQAFVGTFPAQPEGVPLDLWTAGLPHAGMLEPQLVDSDHDGRVDSLVCRFVTGGEGQQEQPVAIVTFLDLAGGTTAAAADAPALRHMPRGIWGMQPTGQFSFDLCIVRRADGVAAVAYTDADRNVSEIRIGRENQNVAQTIWRRDASGTWHAMRAAESTPLIDQTRLTDEQQRRLGLVAGGANTDARNVKSEEPSRAWQKKNSLESKP